MSSPKPGAGDVEITLGDETVILKCHPGAGLTLARQPGSFYGSGTEPGVLAKVLAGDIDMMCLVIRAALGHGPNAVKDLPERVWTAGVLNLRLPLSRYIGALANGGRPIGEEAASEGDENPPTAG